MGRKELTIEDREYGSRYKVVQATKGIINFDQDRIQVVVKTDCGEFYSFSYVVSYDNGVKGQFPLTALQVWPVERSYVCGYSADPPT